MGRNRRAERARELLAAQWPLVFSAKGAPKRPLAIGIGERIALALPEIGKSRLIEALDDYCQGPSYLEACVEGAARVDLDGADCGVVSADHARHAAERLASMRRLANPGR